MARPQTVKRMALNDDIRQFNEIAIFRHLDPDALRLLAFSAETRLLRAGDVLFCEGDASDGAYFLANGAIAIQASRDGAPLAIPAPALLGEIALLTDTVRPATATASALSTVRHVTRALFHRVLDESPGGAVKIRAMLAARLAGYADELSRYGRDGG